LYSPYYLNAICFYTINFITGIGEIINSCEAPLPTLTFPKWAIIPPGPADEIMVKADCDFTNMQAQQLRLTRSKKAFFIIEVLTCKN